MEMNMNNYRTKENIDQLVSREVERKFMPLFPDRLQSLRETSWPVEQFYLSHPSEPFSLRFREELKDGTLTYQAALKDTGTLTPEGIDRMEVTVDVSSHLYAAYRTAEVPIIRKLRAEPRPGITVDFYEDGSVQVESENPVQWQMFIEEYGDMFAETTPDTMSSNEYRAHISFRRMNEGKETLVPKNELKADDIVRDILNQQQPNRPSIVHIGGRSGSGKTTLVNELRQKLKSSWAQLDSVVLSTDDYHRGTKWLTAYNGGQQWTKWDEPIVYDTEAMAKDIHTLMRKQTIPRREIDWTVAEPTITGVIEPASVIIIEGIYATSPDITHPDDLTYEMTTSLATCIGRRLLRDLAMRPEFADPEKSLLYILTEAEPAYRKQFAR